MIETTYDIALSPLAIARTLLDIRLHSQELIYVGKLHTNAVELPLHSSLGSGILLFPWRCNLRWYRWCRGLERRQGFSSSGKTSWITLDYCNHE